MDLPIGCSLLSSAAANKVQKSLSDILSLFSRIKERCTLILPDVKVPVLSNTRVVILFAPSKLLPPLIRMPKLADTPVPTMTAVGVARPRVQGQAITTTDIQIFTQRNKVSALPCVPRCSKKLSAGVNTLKIMYQEIKVKIAKETTTGTKILAIASLTYSIGALTLWAFSTK
eukprot:NODE_153_length_15389_cov_1.201439.p12 type:complete len:172 gc:universal NODE_153_length_15389_cov_1.201439:13829-13314(-)